MAAGPVFVTVFLLEGAVRNGYRPLRHPVSSLALGPRGWIQAGNFAVAGIAFLAGAAGLARAGDPVAGRAAPALIGAAGAGLIGAAVFTTDPVSGYPPGTPDALTHPTRTGIAHNLAAVPVFAGLPAAALASGWRSWRAGRHRFGLYSVGTAVTMLTTIALAGAGFSQSPRLIDLGGQSIEGVAGQRPRAAMTGQVRRQPAPWPPPGQQRPPVIPHVTGRPQAVQQEQDGLPAAALPDPQASVHTRSLSWRLPGPRRPCGAPGTNDLPAAWLRASRRRPPALGWSAVGRFVTCRSCARYHAIGWPP
jgi:Protein of unknown function (DUF998)